MNGLVLADLSTSEYQQTALCQDSWMGEAGTEESCSRILSQTEAVKNTVFKVMLTNCFSTVSFFNTLLKCK